MNHLHTLTTIHSLSCMASANIIAKSNSGLIQNLISSWKERRAIKHKPTEKTKLTKLNHIWMNLPENDLHLKHLLQWYHWQRQPKKITPRTCYKKPWLMKKLNSLLSNNWSVVFQEISSLLCISRPIITIAYKYQLPHSHQWTKMSGKNCHRSTNLAVM